MLAKIHVEFPKLRPDLRHSPDELRDARLDFAADALGLQSLTSMASLSVRQLGQVLDAMKNHTGHPRSQPRGLRLLGSTADAVPYIPTPTPPSSLSPIHHLAGNQQTWAIDRVFDYLEWPDQKREAYIKKRFNRTTAKMLRPDQANALLVQLFTIAASSDLKLERSRDAKISRDDIRAYIPTLKRKLGINQPQIAQMNTVQMSTDANSTERK